MKIRGTVFQTVLGSSTDGGYLLNKQHSLLSNLDLCVCMLITYKYTYMKDASYLTDKQLAFYIL